MYKTTDNQNEIFDIVDVEDNVIGQAKRGEVHGNPKLIHRSVAIAVFNNKNELFLQQRSKTKDTDPLKWTISCSGHVETGKTYKDTANRELKEELGVNLEIFPLVKFLGITTIETEMIMVYKAFSDGSFVLNKEEIVQGKFFTRQKLNELIRKEKIKVNEHGKMSLEKLGWIIH
jgi:isopentenyl-diphosphate Delta-isomerase